MQKPLLLNELFEKQVSQQSHAIALESATRHLTYEELATQSQYLAELLIAQNVKVNQLVAVVMDKGWEQVVAVMGILKSGAAYLPIDPNESAERLNYLLNVSKTNIVLIQSKYSKTLHWLNNKSIIVVDTLNYQRNLNPLPKQATEDDLAYVIFTSGSTGIPKGVMISHKNAVNTILDINERFTVNASDKVFALSSLTFDLSVYDIFGTLAAGGTIVMPTDQQAKDPTQWYELFLSEKISIWNSVPVLMDMFVEYLQCKNLNIKPCPLRLILLSGDWIPLNLPKKIRTSFDDIQIISLGGATEGSIWSILYPIQTIDPVWKSIPYGKPMKNQTFHILNEKLEAVENREPGELFIGGVGVAKGYWRDQKRTQAQFIQHPRYGMVYKTGDLGRYLADGNIEFLGRVDFQVKIAGYRVEINAIEKYLLDFSAIKQAIVLVTKEGVHQKLVAYINFDYTQAINKNGDNVSLAKEQVNQWKTIYDNLYQVNKLNGIDDATFNTAGWTSSYLKQPIPKLQMREWVDNILKRIASLKPTSILEIGCGTGLLLFRLAKIVKEYDGTDLSLNTIQSITNQLPQLNINNVNLIGCEATEIKKINKRYDTIILNSVIQYFPSVDYLIEVLNQCVDKIDNKGSIFVGDIRSLHLLNAFHASVLIYNELNDLSYSEWENNLAKCVDEEHELVIDYNFFYAYKSKNSRISHVEILLKEDKFHNEMTNFRYDVILYIGHQENQENKSNKKINWMDWGNKNINLNLKAIHSIIAQETSTLLAIKNIPNKRTINFPYLINNEYLAQCENWREAFKEYVGENEKKAVDPQLFYEIAKQHNYQAIIIWSKENPAECFDVILTTQHDRFHPEYLALLQSISNTNEQEKSWDFYANLPLIPKANSKLINELKQFLHTRLPQYMIPSYFVPIKELPLTLNGKIDRQALPKIMHAFADKEYVPPSTAIQKKLVSIWNKILGIQNIGIRHNFYDLGGTSLLAIQLIINIHQSFGLELSLEEITACAFTIENLSFAIEEKKLQPVSKN